jgi:hypothetical protein
VWPTCGAGKYRGAVVFLFECRGISSIACCTGKKLYNSSREEILYDGSDPLDLPEQ